MNTFYHKIAVTFVGIALGFGLGANKEVKAATITLTPVTSFGVTGQGRDAPGDRYYNDTQHFHVGMRENYAGQWEEDRAFYEVDIANLFPASTVISSAIFRVRIDSLTASHRYYRMQLFGYRGNGQPDVSDFSPGIGGGGVGGNGPPVSDFEGSIFLDGYSPVGYDPVREFNFEHDFYVTPFVNELISNNNAFAGFSVSSNDYYSMGDATLNWNASLIITTVDVAEPVPEPTTIFGSALALGVGGWLKRKKSSQQDKTVLQR